MVDMNKNKKEKVRDINNKEIESLKAQLARALADYDNLQKRIRREQASIIKLASSVLITKLLPIIDMLEQAQGHLNDAGLAICITEIKNILREEGAVEIEIKLGDEFNEENCEVLETVEGNEENDSKVAEIVTKGWKFNDGGVIRHAKVKVFRKK